MRSLFLLLVFFICNGQGGAQPYVEGGNTRHRFAQLLLGADFMYFPSGGATFQVDGQDRLLPFTPGASLIPRINIAGTHFWGHANFYVSIPVGNLLDSSVPNGGEITFNPGVETGVRLYPWRIERDKVHPFAGAAFGIADWRQSSSRGTGAFAHKTRLPLQAGLTYQRRSLLLEAGLGYDPDNMAAYYADRATPTELELPPLYFWMGINYQLETTLGAEKNYLDGVTEDRTGRLAAGGALNGWSVAIGPSAAFVIGAAPRNEALYPSIGRHRTPNLFFDLGLGYYHYKTDAHLNLAYRANRSERSAYGIEQSLRRRSLALEVFKFLFDFHGFVPFIGPHLSREWYELEESIDGNQQYQARQQQWAAGLTFGWDIRPDALQGAILRTNLRYTPTRDISQVSFRQLEFNFIQLVIYPGRAKRIREGI